MAVPNKSQEISRSKIVPVLPFSLKVRSGIDEDHSKSNWSGTVLYEVRLAKLALQQSNNGFLNFWLSLELLSASELVYHTLFD